jgi:hypothetical protein
MPTQFDKEQQETAAYDTNTQTDKCRRQVTHHLLSTRQHQQEGCTYQDPYNSNLYANVPLVERENMAELANGAVCVFEAFNDGKNYSYKFYDKTGTEIPAEIVTKAITPGAQFTPSVDLFYTIPMLIYVLEYSIKKLMT